MRTPALVAFILLNAQIAAATLPGDSNRDAAVSAPDLTALVQILAGATGNEGADANLDGFILANDLDATIARVFGAKPGEATPTPVATPSVTTTSTATPSVTRSPTPTGTGVPPPSSTRTTTATASGTPLINATPTRTASGTATRSPSATVTAGVGSLGRSAAGSVVVVANGMSAIPSLVTALVSGLQFGGSASFEEGGAAGACPLGGTASRSCPTFNTTMTITLTGCTVATASGSVVVSGTIKLTNGVCPLILPPWNATMDVTATFRNQSNATILIAKANVTGTVSPTLGGSCQATGANLVLTGDVSTQFADNSKITETFQNTNVAISVSAFSQQQCVPINYSMTFDGPATITTSSPGGGSAAVDNPPFAVTFGGFVLQQDATGTPSVLRMDGNVTAACYGGTITLQTLTPLAQAVGQACPTSGVIKVTAPLGMVQLLYLAGGMVGIDTNLDGISDETHPSCLDSALLLCLVQNLPTPTPSATSTESPSATATDTDTETPTATETETESPTPTFSATRTATQILPPTASATVTKTASSTATIPGAPTLTPSPSPSVTSTVTATVTGSLPPSPTPTLKPTATATPSASPTSTPSTTPTATPSATATATPTSSSTRTPTATPSVTPSPTPSPSPTATGTIASALFCDSLSSPALIPDNSAAGINNSIVIPSQISIADLNVRLDVAHTFLGDLKVSLTHVETGTNVILLDRPGIPATVDGCSRDDISCAFDDEAGRVAEDQCLVSSALNPMPAIDGSVKPFAPLSMFDGQSIAGTWRLNISDNAAQDAGSLLGWCLEVNSRAPVVTAFTCNGSQTCTIPLNQAFDLSFSFVAPDGNADGWLLTAISDQNQTFEFDGSISPPKANGTIQVTFNDGFTCLGGGCSTTEVDYFVTVADSSQRSSREMRTHITVLGSP